MKPSINISNITKYYNDKLIFQWADASIWDWEHIALIGKNWSWKSTLFKLILGRERVSEGWVGYRWDICHIEQEMNKNFEDFTIERYFSQYIQDYEMYKVYAAFEELGMSDVDLDRKISELSWWQRKKLLFSKMLITQFNILMLDEPTNHLDTATKDWLIDFIKSFKWIVLCISHDREFINNWATKTLEIFNYKINIFDWNYDSYVEQKEILLKKQQLDYSLYERRRKKMEQWLRELRQRATIYDSPRWWSLLRSKTKYFEREILNKPVEKPKTEKNLTLSINGWTHSGKLIAEFDSYNLSIWEKKLINKIRLRLNGADRVLIRGENGVWKTTFINKLLSFLNWEDKPQNVKVWNNIRIGYFDQKNILWNLDKSVFDWLVVNLPKNTPDVTIKSMLASIGISWPQISKKVNELSYGEKVKLRFLQMITQKVDLLILDEPTNHLDIPTIESLENMLLDYEWAIILISHDEYFVQQLMINRMLEIIDQKLIEL